MPAGTLLVSQASNNLSFRQVDSIRCFFISHIASFVRLTIDTVYHTGMFIQIYVSSHTHALSSMG